MERTISKKRILTLFLGVTAPAIFAGCASVPAPETPAVASVADQPIAVPQTIPVWTNPAPEVVATESEAATETAAVPEATEPEATAVTETPTEAPPAVQENSVWARLRAGFRLPSLDSPLVEQHERWFVENGEFREAMFERSKMYLYFIVEEVEKRGLPMEIALLPAIESAYKPYAYSRAKASGLWQFIPSTGRLYGLKTNWWYDGRRDVVASTRAALDYLQKLNADFDGDWQLAIAAYNAGEGRVMRAMRWNERKGLPTDFAHLRQLKRETKHYVPKLMAMVNIVANPERYGIKLPDIPNEPYFARVETDSQVDLGVIARLSGMEVEDLHYINPGYRRWATDPKGPHHVLVPVDKKEEVLAGLSEVPEDQRVQWAHHRVRRGDTLSQIARRYRVTIQAIRTANNLRGSLLRVGQNLILPISANARVAVASASRSARPVRAAVRTNRPIIYRVRRGDTLSSIARRYNVLVHQIAEWNVMRPNDVLRLGRRLKIWVNNGPSASWRHPDAPAYA